MADYLAILPEICLLVLAFILLLVDLRLPKERKGLLPWLTFVGLVVTLVLTVIFNQPGETELIWGGMLRHDNVTFLFRLVFLFGAGVTALLSIDWKVIGKHGEFYLLLVFSTLGMTLMSASANLVMLFLSIETASIPLYVMAGFLKEEDESTEAGFKYLLFGAMTSAVMLYGFSLLYGFSGTTDIYEIAGKVVENGIPNLALIGSLVLVLVGFGFKISMVPMHFWAPDVYQGAPTPVTGFLSTASKAAGFSVLVRVLLAVFPGAEWSMILAVLSVATMTLGNLVAMRQTNIKRMLAYSSIAHAGYILMGVAAGSEFGITSVMYYIVTYMLTNLAAFGFVIVYYKQVGSDEIKDYAGLSRRNPALAFGMLFTFLSLGGIPPMGGFFAKVLVFSSAVDAGMTWLAVIGVLNAVVGLYYYLSVLKVVYLYRQEGDEEHLPVSRVQGLVLTVCVIGVVLMGTMMAPWYEWMSAAASAFLP